MQEKIKVLIAEDMEPIRKRYVHILSQNEEISVVADVGTGQEACEAARQYQPDVILMDIEMETKDAGIRAAGQILSMYPETRIVILTVYEEDELVFSAFQLGACDYMLKNASSDEP